LRRRVVRYRSSPRWRRFLRLREGSREELVSRRASTVADRVYSLKGVDSVLRVVHDDAVGDEERFVGVGSSKSVHGETSRKTGDGSEERLEGLGEMMGDVVLVDLGEEEKKRARQKAR
jgi:hypothetical protein